MEPVIGISRQRAWKFQVRSIKILRFRDSYSIGERQANAFFIWLYNIQIKCFVGGSVTIELDNGT